MSGTEPSTVLSKKGLAAASCAVGLTLLAVFVLPHGPRDEGFSFGAVERQRLLRFTDRDDGAVLVTDATDHSLVSTITGPNGFLRGTLSGLVRIRRNEKLGAGPPFRLTLYANHRLVLDDPATGNAIELEAFGPTNEAAFARLLP
jgi:putative photosynthetic complex assembly protein